MKDRTNELKQIVKSKQIKIEDYINKGFNSNIYSLIKEGEKRLKEMEKVSPYEKYKLVPLIKDFEIYLIKAKEIKVENFNNRNYSDISQNIQDHLTVKSIEYTLRYNQIKRKAKYNKNTLKRSNNSTAVESDASSLYLERGDLKNNETNNILISEQEEQLKEIEQPMMLRESLRERNIMINRISEIGEIVKDINLHVNLQEEQLKRVDDIVDKSTGWAKKAVNDLKDTWDIVASRRGNLKMFFIFWIIIILMFWFIKR